VKRGKLVVKEWYLADLPETLRTVEGIGEATAFAGGEDKGLHGSLQRFALPVPAISSSIQPPFTQPDP